MRFLPGPERARSRRDLGPADTGALGEEPPGLLLCGHTSEPGLETQTFGNPVVEVSDQHACHGPMLARQLDIVKRYQS